MAGICGTDMRTVCAGAPFATPATCTGRNTSIVACAACAWFHAGSNLSLPDLADGPNAIALVWKHLTVKSKAGSGKVSMG